MPTALPRTVRQAIGDKAADDLEHWHDTEGVFREEYRQVLTRLDMLEHDMQGVQNRLDRIEKRIDTGFHAINQRMDKQTRLMVMALVGFATVISVLLAIAEFA